ncbi:aminodeoxychorismate lyase [Aliivibrio fischeri]|uniref:aminodeoxychorismate lyase n=1 Tax=Aliivibrio fischeri TaxID=668 RepID=UPI0012D87888|nr:aminodeoxychorismate lyase [Aliivibrio fischeri]MUK61135.1 aminodeoxychorismate lyase [Aliivibrio fischeri]MUL21003.1 aminodeoxychorismate lyase [Aliivibrio fischeri]MUL23818.1 aminodeoxychorismate lyase [Aliivibrio fischeri]
MFWVNGMESESLPISDRATQYGDGFFTTMKVLNKKICLWELHLTRLKTSAERLGITEPDWCVLEVQMIKLASKVINGGIKILITRGSGGRGYSPEGCTNTQVIVSTFTLPVEYQEWQQKGIDLGISDIHLGLNPLLAGMKHLNRLEQVLIKQSVKKTDYLDVIVLDINNNIVETTIGNIFWIKDDRIFTPNLSLAGVEGVMKTHISDIAKSHHIDIESVHCNIDTLANADEVFITNSLFEVVPINKIKEIHFTKHTLTHWFQEKLYSC